MSYLKKSMPLQILLAVLLGILFGLFLPSNKIMHFTQIAKMIIHWIRIIAGPFLFFSVVAALMQINTRWKTGFRLILIALLNTSLALLIGIVLTKLFISNAPEINQLLPATNTDVPQATLSWQGWIQTLSPDSLFSPFVKNEILLIALLALIFGITARRTFRDDPQTLQASISLIVKLQKVLESLLIAVLKIVPFVIFFIIAGSVSQSGLQVFTDLWRYVLVVIFALALHCTLVYGTWIFAIAQIPWKTFWQEAKKPIIYSLGINSSLATLPLTLKALKNLKVSDASASLGAGVATNLNNDGIVLYEASAIFFIAHLSGVHWDLWQMILAAAACVVAAMGITGVPEAGFISLSVVVTSLGLPVEYLPILLSVDWVMARLRSAVNVMSDMTLSIALDLFEKDQ